MFKILDEVCTPRRGTKYSAYVDLFAREDVVIIAGETEIVPLGIKIDPNFFIYEIGEVDVDAGGRILSFGKSEKVDKFLKSHYLEIALQNSLALRGLIIPNGTGIIDLDYPDEIELIVHNPLTEKTAREAVMKQIIQANGGDFNKYIFDEGYFINKGDKVAKCTLKEHKGYLMGYESEVTRDEKVGYELYHRVRIKNTKCM